MEVGTWFLSWDMRPQAVLSAGDWKSRQMDRVTEPCCRLMSLRADSAPPGAWGRLSATMQPRHGEKGAATGTGMAPPDQTSALLAGRPVPPRPVGQACSLPSRNQTPQG